MTDLKYPLVDLFTDAMMSLVYLKHACFVRSPHPHAKLVSLDTSIAKSAVGVVILQ